MSDTIHAPAFKIGEYRLILPLSEALQESVMALRKELHEKCRVSLPFELKPHLTILHCHAFEGMEAKLAEKIQQVATRNKTFKVELQDFAAYPSHTIYIHVATRSPFNELAKELKRVRPLTKIPDHEPHFINEPHLVMAQRLKINQFTQMWKQCEHTPFTGKFLASSMVLMKRSEYNSRYKAIRQFDFASLASSVKQGTLFG